MPSQRDIDNVVSRESQVAVTPKQIAMVFSDTRYTALECISDHQASLLDYT